MRRRIVCTVLLILVGFFIVRSNFFTIKAIYVKAEKTNCTDTQTIKNSSNLLGQNLLFLNSPKIKEDLKIKFLCIKDVELSKHFPDRVNLFLSGREAVAILSVLKNKEATESSLQNIATPSAQDSSDSFLVDNEGVIFSKNNGGLILPKIYFYGSNLSLGKNLEAETRNSLKILEKVKVFGLDVQEARVSDNYFIVFSSPKVVFRLDSRVDIQLASLQLILEKTKIDNVRLEFIDLRFDKPAVKFAPKDNANR